MRTKVYSNTGFYRDRRNKNKKEMFLKKSSQYSLILWGKRTFTRDSESGIFSIFFWVPYLLNTTLYGHFRKDSSFFNLSPWLKYQNISIQITLQIGVLNREQAFQQRITYIKYTLHISKPVCTSLKRKPCNK